MLHTIIVSNRLPISVKKVNNRLEYYPTAGGLATGLSSFTKSKSSLWIGWPGIPDEELTAADKIDISRELASHHCFPVFLNKRQIEFFYNGYSNSVLWRLLHDQPITVKDTERMWQVYREVNKLFAETISLKSSPRTRIWIHDYHLLLVPKILRTNNPQATIGFFSHIPFINADDFAKLPESGQLLRGLLGANVIGFHTKGYARNFLDAAQKSGVGVVAIDRVIMREHVAQVTDSPLGIDYKKFSGARTSKVVQAEVKKLRHQYHGRKIILTVDRLEPAKGFIERLNAYRDFLFAHPENHKKVSLIMISIPSRTEVSVYRELKIQVEDLIEQINSQFGSHDWKPIDYVFSTVPFERLSALYQVADVAFVSPLRDGMNLVAKEYVASKSGKSGVLILSKTAGAAEELDQALLVNPTQPIELSAALKRALEMPHHELRRRLKHMQKQLSENTVHTWVGNFMESLDASKKYSLNLTKPLLKSTQTRICQQAKKAQHRLLLLDYDGVLAPYVNEPKAARPSKRLRHVLRQLGDQPNTDVVIMSGRSQAGMEGWFGDLPLTLVAENGAIIRAIGESWHQVVIQRHGWKPIILPVLQKYADLTPGAFIEEKRHSLVWHYRKAAPFIAQKHVTILKRVLTKRLRLFGLRLYSGNKILEIKPPDVHKDTATKLLLQKSHDFVVAIGDDYSDEDMFAALPGRAITIKVGRGLTKAHYRLKTTDQVISLLECLLEA